MDGVKALKALENRALAVVTKRRQSGLFWVSVGFGSSSDVVAFAEALEAHPAVATEKADGGLPQLR